MRRGIIKYKRWKNMKYVKHEGIMLFIILLHLNNKYVTIDLIAPIIGKKFLYVYDKHLLNSRISNHLTYISVPRYKNTWNYLAYN